MPARRAAHAWLCAFAVAAPVYAGDSTSSYFEPGPCAAGIEQPHALAAAGARCGVLTVPETRGVANGRVVRLPVAILPSRTQPALPDPVVYLHGGPGGSALRGAQRWLASPLRERRDLVLFDQRGAGLSEPALCPDLTPDDFRAIAADLAGEAMTRTRVAAGLRCRDALIAAGFDLGAYNSLASAADLEDLRRALGSEYWNLYTLSYGTRLGLELLRSPGAAHVRSIVLDSAYPPNGPGWDSTPAAFVRSIGKLAAACAGEPACSAAHPDLRGEIEALLADLSREPLATDVPRSQLLPDGQFTTNAQDAAIVLHQLLYGREQFAVLPLLVSELRARNAGLRRALVDANTARATRISRGGNLAVECYERSPFASLARARALVAAAPGLARDFSYFEADYALCAAWSDNKAPASQAEAVVSDVPALVLEGDWDPITPPAHGELTAATLGRSQRFLFPYVGHGAFFSGDCGAQLVARFVDAPAAPLDGACTAQITPPRFVTDVVQSAGTYWWAKDLFAAPRPGVQAGFAALGVVLASAFAGWPIAALARRWRGRAQRPGARTRVLAWFAAACALAFWGGLAALVARVAEEMPLLLTIGLPGAARPLFALPWVAAAFVLLGAISWLAEAPAARASRFARSYAALVLIAAASAVTLRFVYAL